MPATDAYARTAFKRDLPQTVTGHHIALRELDAKRRALAARLSGTGADRFPSLTSEELAEDTEVLRASVEEYESKRK